MFSSPAQSTPAREPGPWQQHPAAAPAAQRGRGTAPGTPSAAPSCQPTATNPLRATRSCAGSQRSPAWKAGGGGGRKGFIGKKKKKRSGVMQGCALEGAARSAGVREGWVGGWAGRGTFPYLLRYPSPCAAAAAALRQPPACRRGADL